MSERRHWIFLASFGLGIGVADRGDERRFAKAICLVTTRRTVMPRRPPRPAGRARRASRAGKTPAGQSFVYVRGGGGKQARRMGQRNRGCGGGSGIRTH